MVTVLSAIFVTFLLLAGGVGLFVARRALRRRRRLRRVGAPGITRSLTSKETATTDADALLHELAVLTAHLRCELEATLQQATEYTRLHGQLGQTTRTPLWLRMEAEALDHAAVLVTRSLIEWEASARAARSEANARNSLQGSEFDGLLEQTTAWISDEPEQIDDIARLRTLVDGARALEHDLASRRGTHYR